MARRRGQKKKAQTQAQAQAQGQVEPQQQPQAQTQVEPQPQPQPQLQPQPPAQLQSQPPPQLQPQPQPAVQGQSKAKKRNKRVSEAVAVEISRILQEFQSSTDEVYKFEAHRSNGCRFFVHQLCKKMGFKSKSHGRGKERCVSAYKSQTALVNINALQKLPHLSFSEESKEVLRKLFTNYPPGDDSDLGQIIARKHSENRGKTRRKKDELFCRPHMSKAEIKKKLGSLTSQMKALNLQKLAEVKSKLPIVRYKDAITSLVESHQVVLISGETGCGKTTQVPQYILDHMWGKGKSCKIVCTQPRRISATSVAERIANERGQNVGDDIGYKIRLESKGGRQTSVVICTTGILLRVMVSKSERSETRAAAPEISEITHIIMDEVHERDRYSDFMLAIIRDILPLNPQLHLIMMSATVDAERFSEYFGGCPIVCVPGFTHPVRSYYLEDILSIIKSTEENHLVMTMPSDSTRRIELTEEDRHAFDEAISLAWSNNELDALLEMVLTSGSAELLNYKQSSTGLTPLMVFSGKGTVGDVCMLLTIRADYSLHANDGRTALEIAEQEGQLDIAEILRKHMDSAFSSSVEKQNLLEKYLTTVKPEIIDDVLIEQLLRKICTDSEDGGILVFLPGWDDINRTRDRLLASPFFQSTAKFLIIPLHSMVPSSEQKKVFKRPTRGCRKIILATNIAETAITIDDIVYVIDTGRMKEKSYDPYSNISTLHSSWISKASAKQREGRAGRCRPGICYHLYSKFRAASFNEFPVPEINRVPIEELCLQVKLLDPNCNIRDFLRKLLDPPVSETINNAMVALQDVGALSRDEKLTELGEKLGCLPVHPSISKMLLFAILMNCLDPALTLACAADYRDPFTLPMLPNERKKADESRATLASLYGGYSDQLAVIAAYECWRKAKSCGQERRFCNELYVSSSTMGMLCGMRKQLESELIRNGFIPENNSSYSSNSRDIGVLHSVLVAGLYPMVGRLEKGKKNCVVETSNLGKVRLHPHSANSKLSVKKLSVRPLIVFDEITRGDGGLSIRKCTIVGPLPLLLLSSEIAVAPVKSDNGDDNSDSAAEAPGADGMVIDKKSDGHNEGKLMAAPDNAVKIIMDRWLYFVSTALDVAQLYCLRERLAAAILFKVTNPRENLPPVLDASVDAMARILSLDGVSGKPQTLVGAGETDKDQRQIRFLRQLMDSDRRQVPATEPYCNSKLPLMSPGGVSLNPCLNPPPPGTLFIPTQTPPPPGTLFIPTQIPVPQFIDNTGNNEQSRKRNRKRRRGSSQCVTSEAAV